MIHTVVGYTIILSRKTILNSGLYQKLIVCGGSILKNFITNDKTQLIDVISQIAQEIENCYFLVGYFYFTGFEQICECLSDRNIRILIGMELDRTTQNIFAEVYKLKEQNFSDREIKNNYFEGFKEFINTTEYFDLAVNQKTLNIFIEKLRDGTLQIRKARQPTHSKIYLFEKKNPTQFAPGYLIVGSSNLTYNGLAGQNEIDVFLSEAIYFEQAKEIFDHLWKDSVEVISENNLPEFEEKVLNKTWLFTMPSPKQLYIKVLDEYFSTNQIQTTSLPSKITDGKFLDLRYQLDAISRAIKILQEHSGVLIADVVGLGKTVIASAIAHILKMKTVIIVPPHLISTWESFRYDFDFNGKIFSLGKLEEALDFVESNNGEKLIIVDEAHRYRNQSVQSYLLMHKICSGNKVILLTATPFNNRPSDIFSMLKLFQIPSAPTITSERTNLQRIFEDLDRDFKQAIENNDESRIKEISDQVREILTPVIIRRTRIDLMKIEEYRKDLESQQIKFPEIQSPKSLVYDLDELADLYIDTIEKICPKDEDQKDFFKAARYRVTSYVKDIDKYKEKLIEHFKTENFELAQQNIAYMIRRLLAHRFESSIFAFKSTLQRIMESTNLMVKWYDKGYVPLFKKGAIIDPDEIFDTDESNDMQLINDTDLLENALDRLEQKGYFFIKSHELKKSFKDDLLKDIDILKKIYRDWFDQQKEDKKLKAFKKILSELYKENPQRKIVVFSMFADTVDYLYNQLKDVFRTLKFTTADSTNKLRNLIKIEFDALYNDSNEYRLLLTTDALSEGVNLNKADVIINYDIPYNPTRVIQRVGRLNRIGKNVQQKIYIYNYFPTLLGEKETLVKRISTAKIHMFNFILGTDTKVLTDQEKINSYFAQQLENEELSWDVEYLNDLNKAKISDKSTYERAIKLPPRVRVKINKADKNGVLVFTRKNNILNFVLVDDNSCEVISPKDGLAIFKKNCESNYSKTDEMLEKYMSYLKSKFRINSQILSRSEQELVNYIDFFEQEYNLKSEYLSKLKKAITHSAIPNYAVKELLRKLKDVARSTGKNLNWLNELQLIVPEKYLENIVSSIEQYSKRIEDAQIIIIEQLSKD